MSNRNVPLYGQPYEFYVTLRSQTDSRLFQINPTLASGDVKISKDGGATANITTLPTVTPASGARVKVTLSASEMTCDQLGVLFSDAADQEWCDLYVHIQPIKGLIFGGSVDDASASSTSFITTLTGLGTNALVNRWLVFTTGSLIGQSQKISTYNTSNGTVTFATGFTAAPADEDDFIIVGASG